MHSERSRTWRVHLAIAVLVLFFGGGLVWWRLVLSRPPLDVPVPPIPGTDRSLIWAFEPDKERRCKVVFEEPGGKGRVLASVISDLLHMESRSPDGKWVVFSCLFGERCRKGWCRTDSGQIVWAQQPPSEGASGGGRSGLVSRVTGSRTSRLALPEAVAWGDVIGWGRKGPVILTMAVVQAPTSKAAGRAGATVITPLYVYEAATGKVLRQRDLPMLVDPAGYDRRLRAWVVVGFEGPIGPGALSVYAAPSLFRMAGWHAVAVRGDLGAGPHVLSPRGDQMAWARTEATGGATTTSDVVVYTFASQRLATIATGLPDVSNLLWSPEGTRLAFDTWQSGPGSENHRTVRVWDSCTGYVQVICKESGLFPGEGAWSPDGKWMALCYETTKGSQGIIVDLSDLTKPRIVRTVPGATSVVWAR